MWYSTTSKYVAVIIQGPSPLQVFLRSSGGTSSVVLQRRSLARESWVMGGGGGSCRCCAIALVSALLASDQLRYVAALDPRFGRITEESVRLWCRSSGAGGALEERGRVFLVPDDGLRARCLSFSRWACPADGRRPHAHSRGRSMSVGSEGTRMWKGSVVALWRRFDRLGDRERKPAFLEVSGGSWSARCRFCARLPSGCSELLEKRRQYPSLRRVVSSRSRAS